MTMSTRAFVRLGILTLALALVVPGCSKNDNPLSTSDTTSIGGSNSIDQVDLNQSYGGLAYTDEAPAFDDPQLQSETRSMDQNLMAEDDEDSMVAEDPELRDSPRLKRTYLRILWGQLDSQPSSDAAAPSTGLDWSGSLKVTGGVLALKRTILFEWPADHLLPRSDRQSLSWVSHTGPHFDGLLLCVLQRPDTTGSYPEGSISFDSGPYSTTIDLADLDGLDRTESVDDQGNAISFEGKTLSDCPAGFMRGYWVRVPGINGGFFRGHWVSQLGAVRGHMRGRWGVNEAGERVFAGKIIDRAGKVRGLIEGSWQPEQDGMGELSGHWAAQSGQIEGEFHGKFITRSDLGLGFFRASWSAECGAPVVDAPPDTLPDTPPEPPTTGDSGR